MAHIYDLLNQQFPSQVKVRIYQTIKVMNHQPNKNLRKTWFYFLLLYFYMVWHCYQIMVILCSNRLHYFYLTAPQHLLLSNVLSPSLTHFIIIMQFVPLLCEFTTYEEEEEKQKWTSDTSLKHHTHTHICKRDVEKSFCGCVNA